MIDIKKIADEADMIINGYAFTKSEDLVRVLNLNDVSKAAVIKNDELIETTMDDIEAEIVMDYYENNKKFMEDVEYAEIL